jgi:hypothetical protein
MRNVLENSCRENENTLFMFSNFLAISAVYEVIRKNYVELARPLMAVWRMRIACWIPKATNPH